MNAKPQVVGFFLMLMLSYLAEPNVANAQVNNDLAAGQEHLVAAIENARQSAQALTANGVLSYKSTFEDNHGQVITTPVTLSVENLTKDNNQQGHQTPNVNINFPFVLGMTAFSLDKAQLVSQTPEAWIYQGNLSTQVNEAGNLTASEKKKLSKSMSSNLTSEIKVSKAKGHIQELRVFSQHAFSPQLMVNVERFEVTVFYQQAWENGPLIAHSKLQVIKGSYGLFFDIDELSTEVFSEFSFREQG